VAATGGGRTLAEAETRVTLKSASSTSSYYVMMVQLGEMLQTQSDGEILPTVEESQGSVQNVTEAGRRPGAFLFTTPPNLIANALAGEEPFEEGNYEGIRTLFPMPFITIHLVVRADSDIEHGRRSGRAQLHLGRDRHVLPAAGGLDLRDAGHRRQRDRARDGTVGRAGGAAQQPGRRLRDLFVASHPAGAGTGRDLPVRILSFTEDEQAAIIEANPGAGAVSIAAGTYAGIEGDDRHDGRAGGRLCHQHGRGDRAGHRQRLLGAARGRWPNQPLVGGRDARAGAATGRAAA
jgi:uncharacterized protein